MIDAPKLVEDDIQRVKDGGDTQYWMPKEYSQLLYTIGLSTNSGKIEIAGYELRILTPA